ncbi:MAG: hypothetical protein GWP06_13595 [Actinobacteria bacterium]|nr:hypothetical protein [Actinomycetota bacterium]
MNILGISDVTGNHSHSCVALLQDGKLTFALSQERISRVKNDSRFPADALQTALDFAGLRLDDIDRFACGYPPPNYYFSMMMRSLYDLPRSLLHAAFHTPVKLAKYLTPNIRKGIFDPKGINGLLKLGVPQKKLVFIDHHLSHVSAGYFSSNFDECIGISYGGFAPHVSGLNVAGAVYRCRGDEIEFLEDIPMFATGCYYSGITVALGFNYMQQEGKTMGLAAQGDPDACYADLKKLTCSFRDDGWQPYKFWIDYVMSPRKDVFLATKSGRRINKLIRKYSSQSVAAAAQKLWEENILSFIHYLMAKYSANKFVLSGGVFLNVQINEKIAAMEGVDDIFIHPHTGDGSTTLGAMVEVHRQLTGKPMRIPSDDTGLGVEYSLAAIENDLRRTSGNIAYAKLDEMIPRYTAEQLAKGKIIGWFHGREEYGHRALGHRCILGDPRDERIRDKITTAVKGRERFIPIAPSCLAEHGADYFENFDASPFMTRAHKVKTAMRRVIPGAVHSDGTARAQAVAADFYKPFRKMLQDFYNITETPMVLNTSFNRHGEPIVHQPLEALRMFLQTEMDELVLGPYIVKKIN